MKANTTTSRLKSVNIIVIYLKDRNLSTVVGEKRNAQRGLKMGPSHSRWLTPPSLRSRLAHYEHSLTPACLGPCCHNLPEAVSPASGHSSGLGLKVRHNHSQAVHCFTVTHPETGRNGETTMAQQTTMTWADSTHMFSPIATHFPGFLVHACPLCTLHTAALAEQWLQHWPSQRQVSPSKFSSFFIFKDLFHF